ncbi:hypothetical protein BGM26_01645 [Bacillus sp. FJAT-29790]|uniref:hypothetical protein n=1 Tax=Bacillus sp. FJAT-29790 TaxID=1895002 RepID=UPI001C22A1E4|nr:hypothetical protein [Bacillus sp. FJAT-29790]MBU8877691.1 hypothetical protein [Bacillus sp. FJAT-29790]
MVTAILIPIICLYFYWLTKKEMRESNEKWLQLKKVTEEAVISGTIVDLKGQRQRFSYYRYVYVLELAIQTELKKWQVKRVIPIEKGFQIPNLTIGEFINAYGNWKEDSFHVNRIEKRAK